MRTFDLVLTRAIIIDGRVRRSGAAVSLPERLAKRLLDSGKATLVPEQGPALDGMTAADLRDLAAEYGLDAPARASKADLVAMLKDAKE